MSDALDPVIEILRDDAFRSGGSVSLDRILSISAKRSLGPAEIAAVKRRLLSSGVAIELGDSEEPDSHGAEDGSSGGWQRARTPADDSADDEDQILDVLASFHREARSIPFLARDEEGRLARRIQAGLEARKRIETEEGEPAPDLQALVDDGHAAWTHLVEANLLLVPFVARKFVTPGSLPDEDLIQEGNLGLMHAAKKFDGQAGTKFSTYAVWWIWSHMQRAVHNGSRLVRLPVHLAERLPRLRKIRARLARERGGLDPTPEQLAEHLELSLETTWFLLLALEGIASIDSSRDADGTPLSRRLPAHQALDPETQVIKNVTRETIQSLIASLGPRLSTIITQRFGLTGAPKTLREIGEELGVTRERIRQLEAKALARLRKQPKRAILQEFLWEGPMPGIQAKG